MKLFFLVLGISWVVITILVGFGFYALDRFLSTVASLGTATFFIITFAEMS